MASIIIKYQGNNLTKDVKGLYEENWKLLKKEIEHYRRQKDLPYSWIGKINIVKIAILSTYKFNAIPMKIPMIRRLKNQP
jgi:hypothetical protein